MKSILVLVYTIFITSNVTAEDISQGFCLAEADIYKSTLEDKIKEKSGITQSYEEVELISYTKEVLDMDHLTEVYHFMINANSIEGDYWTSEYEVKMDTWLSANGKASHCGLISLNYLGVTK